MVADSLPDRVVVFVTFEADTANRSLFLMFGCEYCRQVGLLLAARFGGCSRSPIFTYQCLGWDCDCRFALLAGDKSSIGDFGSCKLDFRRGEEALLDRFDGWRSVAVANGTKAHDLGGI
jgi:hypothetical protein